MEKKCSVLLGKPTQREQSGDIGTETMTAWVGLIWLTVIIHERLF
jgi:hypothetical protein